MENELDKIKKILAERKSHYANWLKQQKEAQNMIPHVQSALDMVTWEEQQYSLMPGEASAYIPGEMIEKKKDENKIIKGSLPLHKDFDTSLIIDMRVIEASGTATAAQTAISLLNSDEKGKYSNLNNIIKNYGRLQEKQNKLDLVEELIVRLENDDLLKRFLRAKDAYLKSKSNAASRREVALESRNFLNLLIGVLKNKSKALYKKRKCWEQIIEYFINDDNSGIKKGELLIQYDIQSQLLEDFTNILKDKEFKKGKIDLINIWLQLLEHIYVVLSLMLK